MRFKSQYRAFAVLIACGLTGCGDGSKENKKSAPAPKDDRKVFSLHGLENSSFKSACVPEEGQVDRSETEMFTLSENTFKNVWANFDGPDCNPSKKLTTYTKLLARVEEMTTPDIPGWISFRYTYQSYTATAHLKTIVDLFNSNHTFGFTDWAVDRPEEISGRKYKESSAARPAVGAIRWSTLKVDSDTLLFARYSNNIAYADKPYVFKRIKGSN